MPWYGGGRGMPSARAATLLVLLLWPALSSAAWYSGVYSGTAQPRGWSYVSTNLTLTTGDTDDGFYKVPLPFSFSFLGTSYSSVYISTNTFLTFGSGSMERVGLGSTSPPFKTLFIAGADNSCQRAGYRTDGSTYTWLRYEGSDGTSGTVGSPTIVFEALFAVNGYLELRVGPNARTTGVHGVSNGQGFFKTYDTSGTYNSLVFTDLSSTVSVSNKTSSWLLDPFSSTPPPTLAPTTHSPTPRPTPSPSTTPTQKPSPGPTGNPTSRPTKVPTTKPTGRPTKTPTDAPSRPPTTTPTLQPTSPTTSPTTAPSRVPTLTPSRSPTSSPTPYPTMAPSVPPTVAPSLRPTLPPTQRPTKVPSAQPSIRPTLYPTALPTTVPTPAPTQRPSRYPTAHPTTGPTPAPTWRPTTFPTQAPSLPPHYGAAVVTSLNSQSNSFAITSANLVTDFSIQVENVTSISIRALISGSTYTLLSLDLSDSTARRRLVAASTDGKNLTLSINTGQLWWNAGVAKIQGSIHLEVANQIGQVIAYYDTYANVTYANYLSVTSSLTNNSGLYEGTTMAFSMVYETTNRSLTAIDVTLGNATHAHYKLANYTLTSFSDSFSYTLSLNYDTIKNELGLVEGQVVYVRVGYRNHHAAVLYRLTVAYKAIKSMTIDDPTCIYRGRCRVEWTSDNPYTTATLYLLNTDTGPVTISRKNGAVYSSQSSKPLQQSSSTLSATSPGTIDFRATFEQTGIFFGAFTMFLVCDDDIGSLLRYQSGPIDVICPPLYYGTYCETKQSILNSMIVGTVLVVLTFLWTAIVLWGAWLDRWSERVRYFVTDRAVQSVRSFVGTVELQEKISDWGRNTNPMQRNWDSWRDSYRGKNRTSGDEDDLDGSGEEGQYEDGEGSNPDQDAVGDGADSVQSAEAQVVNQHEDPDREGGKPPAAKSQELDNTTGQAIRDAGAVRGAKGSGADCCPIKPHLMIKEAIVWFAAYCGILFAQYLADIAMILANSYVLASSMARSANTPIDLFYDGVIITLNYSLPRFVNWFPRLFSKIIKSFTFLVEHISFNMVFVKTFNVTCLGAQAPGQALTNVVLGSAIFLVFEMSFFEFIRVTFQGVSAAAPRFLRKEKPNASRFAALALPALAALVEYILKYSLQLFLSMFAIAPFITRQGYHESTQICNDEFYDMDGYLAWVGTGLFWMSVLPIIHVVINGLVPGVPNKHHMAAPSLMARNKALEQLKEETQKLKGCCSLPQWCANVLTITASQVVNVLFGFSGKEGLEDGRGSGSNMRAGRGSGDGFDTDMCILQQRFRCRPFRHLCWSYQDEDEDDDNHHRHNNDHRIRRRTQRSEDEDVLSCTVTIQIDRIVRLGLLSGMLLFSLGYVVAAIIIRRTVITGLSARSRCIGQGQTAAYCENEYLTAIEAARTAYSSLNVAYYSALAALPFAGFWVLIRAVYTWHLRECYTGVEFQNLQQQLPDGFLRCCGFLTYSEWKLHNRFRRRMQKIQAAMVGTTRRGFWSRSPTPNVTPTGSPRATIKSPRALKLWNKPLPRPWPSCLAVFQLIAPEHTEEITWEDLENAHAALEALRTSNDRPAACSEERLDQCFVYVLMEKCKDPVYEATVKEIFVSVVKEQQGDEDGAGIRSGFSSADGEDLLKTAFSLGATINVDKVRMDYKAFRHFANVLAPPLAMPSFFEVAVLILMDFVKAVDRWRTHDRCQVLLLWKILRYWWSRTPRAYVIIMLWKLKQLVKCSGGIWDRETIEAFQVREKADEFQDDPTPQTLKEDKRFKDLDLMCAMGQSRCLFWQLLPQTVIFSKLAEAINKSPLYVEDDAMTHKTAILKARRVDEGVQYAVGPLVRQVAPFAPQGLLWFFPLEPQRAVEAKEESLLRRSTFQGMKETRLAGFLASVALFFTTVLLTVVPTVLWVQIYFFVTLPVRCALSVELVNDTLHIQTPNLTKFVDLLKWCCGRAKKDLKVVACRPNEGFVSLVTTSQSADAEPGLGETATVIPAPGDQSMQPPSQLTTSINESTLLMTSPVVNPIAKRPSLAIITAVAGPNTDGNAEPRESPRPYSTMRVQFDEEPIDEDLSVEEKHEVEDVPLISSMPEEAVLNSALSYQGLTHIGNSTATGEGRMVSPQDAEEQQLQSSELGPNELRVQQGLLHEGVHTDSALGSCALQQAAVGPERGILTNPEALTDVETASSASTAIPCAGLKEGDTEPLQADDAAGAYANDMEGSTARQLDRGECVAAVDAVVQHASDAEAGRTIETLNSVCSDQGTVTEPSSSSAVIHVDEQSEGDQQPATLAPASDSDPAARDAEEDHEKPSEDQGSIADPSLPVGSAPLEVEDLEQDDEGSPDDKRSGDAMDSVGDEAPPLLPSTVDSVAASSVEELSTASAPTTSELTGDQPLQLEEPSSSSGAGDSQTSCESGLDMTPAPQTADHTLQTVQDNSTVATMSSEPSELASQTGLCPDRDPHLAPLAEDQAVSIMATADDCVSPSSVGQPTLPGSGEAAASSTTTEISLDRLSGEAIAPAVELMSDDSMVLPNEPTLGAEVVTLQDGENLPLTEDVGPLTSGGLGQDVTSAEEPDVLLPSSSIVEAPTVAEQLAPTNSAASSLAEDNSTSASAISEMDGVPPAQELEESAPSVADGQRPPQNELFMSTPSHLAVDAMALQQDSPALTAMDREMGGSTRHEVVSPRDGADQEEKDGAGVANECAASGQAMTMPDQEAEPAHPVQISAEVPVEVASFAEPPSPTGLTPVGDVHGQLSVMATGAANEEELTASLPTAAATIPEGTDVLSPRGSNKKKKKQKKKKAGMQDGKEEEDDDVDAGVTLERSATQPAAPLVPVSGDDTKGVDTQDATTIADRTSLQVPGVEEAVPAPPTVVLTTEQSSERATSASSVHLEPFTISTGGAAEGEHAVGLPAALAVTAETQVEISTRSELVSPRGDKKKKKRKKKKKSKEEEDEEDDDMDGGGDDTAGPTMMAPLASTAVGADEDAKMSDTQTVTTGMGLQSGPASSGQSSVEGANVYVEPANRVAAGAQLEAQQHSSMLALDVGRLPAAISPAAEADMEVTARSEVISPREDKKKKKKRKQKTSKKAEEPDHDDEDEPNDAVAGGDAVVG